MVCVVSYQGLQFSDSFYLKYTPQIFQGVRGWIWVNKIGKSLKNIKDSLGQLFKQSLIKAMV